MLQKQILIELSIGLNVCLFAIFLDGFDEIVQITHVLFYLFAVVLLVRRQVLNLGAVLRGWARYRGTSIPVRLGGPLSSTRVRSLM